MISLVNVLTAIGPAICLAAYATLVGVGLQAAIASQVRFAVSLGVVCGVGLGAIAVTMCLAHVLLGNAELPLIPLSILAVVAISARIMAIRRQGKQPLGQMLADTLRTVTLQDVIAVAAATLVMLPVLRYGLTYWTTGTHDFPSYAASAQIWSTSPSAFSELHPDAFGRGQVGRASVEKPMVTALLVALSKLSGVPPFQLLAPAMLVFLYLSFSSALTLCSSLFRLRPFPTAVAVLLPSLSLVPMSRVYDAQLGQVAAVALVACLFAVVVSTPAPRTAKSAFAVAAVAALVWAAAVGSNFTLIVGSGLGLGVLLIWAVLQERDHHLLRLKGVGLAALTMAVLSAPMLGMYARSFSSQTTGEPGYNVPLVLPLAALGQQLALYQTTPTSQALLAWGVVVLGLLALIWLRGFSDRRSAILDFALLAALVANVLVIALKLGWANYGVHKWMGVTIAITMPLILTYWLSILEGRARKAVTAVLAVLVLTSTTISLSGARQMGFVASGDLMSLKASPQLAAEQNLNLALRGNMSESAIAALLVPSRTVVVTDQTYAQAAAPIGNRFLVRTDQLARAPYSEIAQLNDTYALASLDLTLRQQSVDFTTADPASARFLFGNWYPTEPGGTWSGQNNNYLVFDLPPELRNRDVRLAVTGHAFANAEASQKIQVLVNGTQMLELLYPSDAGKPIEFVVPAAVSEAAAGRITVDFRTARLLSPSAFGSADRRSLAFMLIHLDVAPL